MSQKRAKARNTMFGTTDFPAYEEIVEEYSKEFDRLITPSGDTVFGFWMQTIADIQLLDLELQGLKEQYEIDPITRTEHFKGDFEFLRLRAAHLEKVAGKKTLYMDFADSHGDMNAYAFHNLYPFKGKFYPRVVRTLINAFGLRTGDLIIDPFNGSRTTTHEASLVGIDTVGIDITPVGVILSEIKNELPFLPRSELDFKINELIDVLRAIEEKNWHHPNDMVEKLMLVIYFDTADAFIRTSRYNKKEKKILLAEKFEYIRDCYDKVLRIKEKYGTEFQKARIIEGDALDLRNLGEFHEKFDAIITSPPYYFSIHYVGKDRAPMSISEGI